MAVPYYGDIAEDATVRIPFNTFDSNDPQASVTITNLVDADIKVHKDGGLTQIATDGATVIINFDSITGNHLITIDTSVHADYSTGSEYQVRIEGTTVDAGTINAWVGTFSIERSNGVLALLTGTNSLSAIKTDTAATLTDTADMQPRVAAIEVDTGTTLQAELDAIQAAVITNAAGADIAADIIALKAETASILTDTGTTLDTKLNDIQGATFSSATDSLESIRDRGDAAWTTGGGGSILDILNIHPLIPSEIDLANTATWRLGLMLINSLDDLPTTGEITPGTIDIDRKAIGGTSWTSIVSGAACSELAGMVYYDEVFDSGTGYAEGDSLRVTFYSQKITVSANDFEISDANGRAFYTSVRQTMRGTELAATATALTTVQNDLDIITGSDGVTLATAQGLYAPSKAGDSMDMSSISGDTVAADNMEATYDGTGYVDDNAPATQSQLAGISTGAVASSISPLSYTLTTGNLSSGIVGDVDSIGTPHVHTDASGVMTLIYHTEIGAGTPSNITLDYYLQGGNDNLDVNVYDWVAATYKKVGLLDGKNNTNNVNITFPINANMVGTGVDLGKVNVQFDNGATTLTSATFSLDRMYISYNQTSGGYARGIEVDTNGSNTNTVLGIDGVIGNPVSTWSAALSLAAKANNYDFHIHNGSTVALTGNSDNYTIIGESYALSLGGQSIANAYISGCTSLSGVSSGSGAKIVDCLFGASISLSSGWFKDCRLNGTITLLTTGGYFFQSCFSTTGTIPIIDLSAAVGTQTICLTPLTGGVQVNNMKAGDLVHIEGGGEITLDATCTAGTLEYAGDWRLTDNSSGVTLSPGDNTANISSTLADTNELQTDWTNGGRLDLLIDAIKAVTDLHPDAGALLDLAAILAFLDDPRGEPGQGAPAVNPDLATKIDYLYKNWRNKKEETATTFSLYNDAGSVVDQKATVADDGTTASKTEIIAGP